MRQPGILGTRRPAGRGVVSKGLSIRAVVLVGFILTLALWLASGIGLLRRLGEVETRTKDLERRFAQADDLLTVVRTETLLGSVYLRDALLDVPENADYYRNRLQQARESIDHALSKYAGRGDAAGQGAAVGRLRSEVHDFWNTVMPALSWDTERRATQTRTLLRTHVMPRRKVIIAISDEVQQLNRVALEEQQRQLGAIYTGLRIRVWETSIGVLLLGVGVAFLVIRHTGRLERQLDAQRLRERQAAVNLQRLSAQLVRAQEEERKSIARELHDEIGQALTAIKVELAVVERALTPNAQHDHVLGDARAITDRALQTVRDLSQLLHPPLLDDLGLAATIDWYLKGFSNRTSIVGELVESGMQDRLSPEIEVCVYRIVQEALTNVARHSKATSCRVYLQRLPQTVLVTVEDNGVGFDVDATTSQRAGRGLGLLGMRERAVGFGGEFRVESAPAHGTRVTVELPALAPEEASGAEKHEPHADGPPQEVN